MSCGRPRPKVEMPRCYPCMPRVVMRPCLPICAPCPMNYGQYNRGVIRREEAWKSIKRHELYEKDRSNTNVRIMQGTGKKPHELLMNQEQLGAAKFYMQALRGMRGRMPRQCLESLLNLKASCPKIKPETMVKRLYTTSGFPVWSKNEHNPTWLNSKVWRKQYENEELSLVKSPVPSNYMCGPAPCRPVNFEVVGKRAPLHVKKPCKPRNGMRKCD